MGINFTRKVHVPADPTTDTFTGKVVSAEWKGGAYVDLFFGGHRESAEVINVYDHATGSVDRRVMTPAGLKAIVREWITANDEEWSEWYAEYVANSR